MFLLGKFNSTKNAKVTRRRRLGFVMMIQIPKEKTEDLSIGQEEGSHFLERYRITAGNSSKGGSQGNR